MRHHTTMEGVVTDDTNRHRQKNFKAMRTLAIIVGSFYFAWTPFTVEHLFKAFNGSDGNIPQWAEITMLFTAISNSFWNPIIYMGTNKAFRKGGLQLLGRMCCINKVEPTENTDSLVL